MCLIKPLNAAVYNQFASVRLIIFEPGFSTKEEVDHVSGRGIGMDVIKTSVLQLDGDISINSKLGEGTSFEFKLPILK